MRNNPNLRTRYVARFVNGAHVVLDTETYRHVDVRTTARAASEAAARRNAAA